MNHWSTHQLTEFFAAVCEPQDERTAMSTAVERATEVLETEVGGVLCSGAVEVAWGISDDVLEGAVRTAAGAAKLDLPGLGPLHSAAAWFGPERTCALLVARAGDPLDGEERQLLQAMAQTLELALRNISLLTAERRLREERERESAERLELLESLYQARHDALTGLPSRGMFLDLLAERAAATVLFIDLDKFKAVNDTLGHAAGDELLIQVAGRIRECLRAYDIAARLGGDEFAVLLEGTEREHGVTIAERLIESISRPYRICGHDATIGASVGVASGGGDPAALLAQADAAMYAAKKSGAGRVVVCPPTA